MIITNRISCIFIIILNFLTFLNVVTSNLAIDIQVDIWLNNDSPIRNTLIDSLDRMLPQFSYPLYQHIIDANRDFDIDIRFVYSLKDIPKRELMNSYNTWIEKSASSLSEDYHEIKLNKLLENENNIFSFIPKRDQNEIKNPFKFDFIIIDDDSDATGNSNPNANDIIKHKFINSNGENVPICTITGSSLIIDLTAEGCKIVSNVVEEQQQQLKKQHFWSSHSEILQKSPYVANKMLLSSVCYYITSALVTYSLGSIDKCSHLASKKEIIVPVLIFKNGLSHEQQQEQKHSTVDFYNNQVQNWIQSLLLPGQEIQLLYSEHRTTEHPQVSVAFALSEMAYSAIDKVRSLVFPQNVPYIDSRKFISEISAIGDRLYDQLLGSMGLFTSTNIHNIALQLIKSGGDHNRMSPSQEIKSFKPEPSNRMNLYDNDNNNEDEDYNNENKITLIPTIVISDLHLFRDRKPWIDGPSMMESQMEMDILPLLDRKYISMNIDEEVNENIVLVLHASKPALIHNPSSNTWTRIKNTTLESTIIASLVEAMVGISLQPLQIWGNNDDKNKNHRMWMLPEPLDPFYDSNHMLQYLSQRTLLVTRAKQILIRIEDMHQAVKIRLEQIMEAFDIISGFTEPPMKDDNVNKEIFDYVVSKLPSECNEHLVWLEDTLVRLSSQKKELKKYFLKPQHSSVKQIMINMNQLEKKLSKDTNSMLSRSRNIISIMSNCKVDLNYRSRKSSKNNNNKNNNKNKNNGENTVVNIPTNAVDIGILVKEHQLEAEMIASNKKNNGHLFNNGYASIWYMIFILIGGISGVFGIKLLQKRVYVMSKKRD